MVMLTPTGTGETVYTLLCSRLSHKEKRAVPCPARRGLRTRPSEVPPRLAPLTSSPMLQTHSHPSCPRNPRPGLTAGQNSIPEFGPHLISPTSPGCPGAQASLGTTGNASHRDSRSRRPLGAVYCS